MPKHRLKIKEKAEILTQENCQKQGNQLKRGPLTPLVNVTVYIFPCPHQYLDTVKQVIFMGNLISLISQKVQIGKIKLLRNCKFYIDNNGKF